MALLEHKIHTHSFIGLNGEVVPPRQMLALDQRPGVSGTEITKEAIKGTPFTLRSFVDVATYAATQHKLDVYLQTIDAGPVELIKGGVSSLGQGFKVQVLDVRELVACSIGGSVGGLTSNPAGFLACEWLLIAIKI